MSCDACPQCLAGGADASVMDKCSQLREQGAERGVIHVDHMLWQVRRNLLREVTQENRTQAGAIFAASMEVLKNSRAVAVAVPAEKQAT